ncbi:SDR family NAD(P)-dependent oxidoreductase [Chromobacterium vaccinii]|uniref:SDR family NAD(P)-dependent oxidoreductase n=1 Tax=Chromobacterium vaccinii TaxID=1108595 RepID=UPI00069855C2|nr:SDR family NAD(P)-dependent oxidoreductase [Chromobacterium vaccinii]
MMDFIEYVASELKEGRLSRDNAFGLIRQYAGQRGAGRPDGARHPLLQHNISDLYHQRYGSSFDGGEFFLADHRVAVQTGEPIRVLPAVAYLEMARAAAVDASPERQASDALRLDDVVWLQPVVADGRVDVLLELSADEGSDIAFEVLSVPGGGGEPSPHCRGTARPSPDEPPAKLDLAGLQARMMAGRLDAKELYAAYHAMGMRFGPAHRPVDWVLRGDGEVLACLSLPAAVGDTLGAFRLHPSLLDGALQAAMGLLADPSAAPDEPSLPFALDSLTVYSGCARRMFAWVRRCPGERGGDLTARLDIDLCDENGRVCAAMRGFCSRPLQNGSADELVIAKPVWREAVASGSHQGSRHVLLCGVADGQADALRRALPGASIECLPWLGEDAASGYEAAALACLRAIQRLFSEEGEVLLQLAVADELHAGLSGLLRTAALERPRLRAQLLLLEPDCNAATLAERLQAESGADALVDYRNGMRKTRGWAALPADERAPLAYKEDGVYLITGGLGGIGALFAADILSQASRARVVLAGRAADGEGIQARLGEIAPDPASRARLHYRQLDLADRNAAARAVADIASAHGGLNGVLHCAGMVRDKLLAGKDEAEFRSVLAPKVAGTINLDLACADSPLDFFALFSSGASVLGNPGQGDYAAANGFLDAFAAHRDQLAEQGLRQGRALAVNWPLWRDGGMSMPESQLAAMFESTGMRALQTQSGMSAFRISLASGVSQTVVVEGDGRRIRQVLFDAPASAGLEPIEEPMPAIVGGDLADKTRDYLRRQFAALFKLAHHKIDARAPLEKYGIDSILAMDLTRQLEKTFGPLSKTLFFEYQSIDELTGYFLRAHADKLDGLFAGARPETAAKRQPPAAPRPAARAMRPLAKPAAAPAQRRDEPIAIVGLSGRYPQAMDVDAFWQKLRDGEDCVTEVPRERWDWREYYSEDRTKPGAHYSKWGGFIEGVDEFDPLFFNIPPVDAEYLDPQERLFLQHAWMAVEDAGYSRAALQIPRDGDLPGQVGVYVGVMYGEYQLFGAEASLDGERVGVPVSYASIANRVSYLLNLHGPSMTLDSMCSSSLTAIHLACQDLKSGRAELAIAGGVNVTIHPNKYLILSAGQYISSDGHCQSFGEGGDGYIPGEGVGAVVLKRLSDAERDGNVIYGVIRGSALNHGGKTNGYSVPNPRAQASVIRQALKDAGVEARHVGYIEAHGTGTKLGDPIEIAALTEVFRESTDRRQFCAIGSAKSNIGHCESAAGIAGLTKVLLQMRHRSLAPSLHSARLNPHIDFESTPFIVNQALRPWDAPEENGRALPRIAGISSFGAGGSNAHLIVAEYIQPAFAGELAGPAIVPLSARTGQQLAQKASDLLAYLRRQEHEPSLSALSHTLQAGREAMDARAAFVVDSLPQLTERLEAFCRGETEIEACFRGDAGRDGDEFASLVRDEDMRETVERWIARGKLERLAEMWTRGLELDWSRLRSGGAGRLISLPAYPFARERYWIADRRKARKAGAAAALHPLLHENASDLARQRYVSRFDGGEFFFADHKLNMAGERRGVLPAAAYLEMARAAAELAMPAEARPAVWRLDNVAWLRPLTAGQAGEVHVALTPRADGGIGFEVLANGENEPFCLGEATPLASAAGPTLDLDALRGAMGAGEMKAAELYRVFESMGMHYGPGFRGVAELFPGEGQALARLALPDMASGYALHPGMLDSALQASAALAGGALPDTPAVPFALDSITAFAPCQTEMHAWLRRDESGRIDIDLCDPSGRVCVQLRGLEVRELRAEGGRDGVLMAEPAWEALPAHAAAQAADAGRRRAALLLGMDGMEPDALRRALPEVDVETLDLPDAAKPAERFQAAALATLKRLHALFAGGQDPVSLQVAVEWGEDELLAGLSGMLDSARQEWPNLRVQLLLTDAARDAVVLAAQLNAAANLPSETLLKFQSGQASGQRWRELAAPQNAPAFRDGGVYLITGGLGGLGRVFARAILERTRDAVVVLSGRAPAGSAQDQALQELAGQAGAAGGRLAYRRVDLADAADVAELVSSIVSQFGALSGVLHSAGMTADGLLAGKDAAGFAKVLAPKAAGTVNLDLATLDIGLDFFALFSSLAGAYGNAGQSDYAAANAFMDRYAEHRARLAKAGLRAGRSLSIAWPLWQEGGMRLDEGQAASLERASGMRPLETANGVAALEAALASGAARVAVAQGDLPKLRRALLEARAEAEPAASVAERTGGEALRDGARRWLAGEFAALLKLPSREVDVRAPLDKYGMDSVLAMKFTQQLERHFGALPKTLLFEYQTLDALAGHLARQYPGAVAAIAGLGHHAAQPEPERPPQAARWLPGAARFTAPPAGGRDEVAIIGLAGRYPRAANLAEFWTNLRDGVDCIGEVPAERWDHARFFDPRRNQPGKTYSKWGGFLDGVDRFDPLFFSISPKEAELMDPQERLFLETAWEAMEDAGYGKTGFAGRRVGVYVGAMWGHYELYGVNAPQDGVPSSSFASIANRVSYFFDFHGPSLALDSMCSSSLTAIHLACEALRGGEADVAIAGGVNVSIHPNKYLNLSQGNFSSSDGRCRSFGAGGDGYVPGEGVGAVVLKPLSRALADGDQVYGIVKASAVNHGGKTNGYTVPNPSAQAEVIRAALDKAGVDAAAIGYVETHGTGTSLGDPIEIAGLARAFGDGLEAQSCPIGSVKSNIGHLESAAGIAALTKVLLQIRHGQLAPSLHADTLNPLIDFNASPFRVQTSSEDWPRRNGQARRACVSSFGAGGSNAHLVIEECLAARPPATADQPEIFLLSARSRAALRVYAERMLAFAATDESAAWADIAYTSQLGREPLPERLAVIAASRDEWRDKLARWLRGEGEAAHEGNVRDAGNGASLLTDGEAGAAFLDVALRQRDLDRLARLWIAGADIAWARLHASGRRVSLPFYPFERERYWLAAALPADAPQAARMPELALRRYGPVWRDQPLAGGEWSGGILLLGAEAALANALKNAGAQVASATAASEYRRAEAGRYELDMASDADFDRLLDDLEQDGLRPRAVLHFSAEGEIAGQLDGGVHALHSLCRAQLRRKNAGPLRILAAARGALPAHAALAGYLRSLTLETPRIAGRVIGAEAAATSDELAAIALAELGDADWRGEEVRYGAQARRQVRAIERCDDADFAGGRTSASIRQGGAYLITGGLGGLGYLLAEHLAREYGTKLALSGRSAADENTESRLAHLRACGGEAVYLQADVADRGQADALVAKILTRFGRLDGVIHSAGAHRDAYAVNKPREDMDAVLAAKVLGTVHLDRATRDLDLDLFVLFSSIAGVAGNAGQCDYAYANRFLDAYAEARAARSSGRTLSIDWPFWADGGMRIANADLELLRERAGIHPLPTALGLRCWDDFLASGLTQGIALYGEAERLDANLAARPRPAASSLAVASGGLGQEAVEAYLKRLLSGEIRLPEDRIDSDERFDAYGLDSVMVNRLNAELERGLGVLPKTLFYECATVAELAGYLRREAAPALSALLAAPMAPAGEAESAEAASTVGLAVASAVAPMESGEKIAIVGIHGRFPGADDLDSFWAHLQAGRDLISPVPAARWNADAWAEGEQGIYCRWGGFLDGVDQFDAPFFGIPDDDARLMDPQERLFLQSAWSALEDAGYTRDSLRRRHPKGRGADVGVFCGVTTNSYQMLAPDEWRRGNMASPASMPWSIANRVSYVFDFNGPSMPVDTACSSSLVAMHLACESLRRGECQAAVAGGVNLYLHPSKYYSLCGRGMLARGAHCRSFGAGDDGFVPGEGVGAVVLKPLSRALADGDHIHGVIAASGYEHSGRGNGYAAPNPGAQAALIGRTLAQAGLSPEAMGYVEGHGTGTQLGDSLEVASLSQAFRAGTDKKQYCPLGSVKSNIGHAESAAGMGGVAKILLQLRHRQIAPTLHAREANPNIDFAASPFYLQHELADWKAVDGQPRRAMINSFGAGGVNACLILEEHLPPIGRSSEALKLFPLSARDGGRLREQAARLAERVAGDQAISLDALAWTLQTGREAMEQRLAIAANDRASLLDALRLAASGETAPVMAEGRVEPHQRRRKLADEELARLRALRDAGETLEIARAWVAGQELDWPLLHQGEPPARLPLPAYPFAQLRYWVSDAAPSQPGTRSQPAALAPRLHPLVAENASTLKEVAFSSCLSGDGFYARDHRINGQRLFPGAGFLELACVAGSIAGERPVAGLEDVVWNQPLRLDAGHSQLVKTVLRGGEDGADCLIVSFDEDNERVVHAEARLVYGRASHGEAAEPIRLDDLKARAVQTKSGADCYAELAKLGFHYGPGFQTIQELHIGEGYALSRLKLADGCLADFDQYSLHPSLVDGALQTVLGVAGQGASAAPHLPFALGGVQLLGRLPPECYACAWLCESAHGRPSDLKQFDILLLNQNGEPLLRLNRLYARAFAGGAGSMGDARLQHAD